jgi:hypothetical protein
VILLASLVVGGSLISNTEDIKVINNLGTFEPVCNKVYSERDIVRYIDTPCDGKNVSCKGSYLKQVVTIENVSIGCIKSGAILSNGVLVNKSRYFCGADNKGVVCDEFKDTHGGGGDGNGDGICQEGERCVKQ